MSKRITPPPIVWQYGLVPRDGDSGDYLICCVDDDFNGNYFVIANLTESGFLDTKGYIPEEEIIAHAYLPAQRFKSPAGHGATGN